MPGVVAEVTGLVIGESRISIEPPAVTAVLKPPPTLITLDPVFTEHEDIV